MPSSKRWVVVSSLALGVALSCAEAEDQRADFDPTDEGGSSGRGGSSSNVAGKSTAGGKSGGASGSSTGGKGGMGGANHAGTATAGGKAGTAPVEEGGADTGGSAGSGSMALGCIVEAMGGAGVAEGGAANAGAAGEVSAAGAPSASGGADTGSGGADAGPLALFSDDFESGQATQWTPTGGTWAVVDDGSKVYEQSLLENKLQISIANDTCFADQVIDARVKVTEFKGQSNSYVAAVFGRVLGPQTHYLLALGSDKKLILRKRVNSTSTSATAIGSAVALTVTPDQWYDVRFEIIGTSLKGCVGAVCVTGTDSSISSGGVAVGTVNTSARFDDVRVTAP